MLCVLWLLVNIILAVILQVEQVSFAAVLDVLIIIVMAAIWAFMPSDGIAIVTQWFYNKVIEVMHERICLCYCLTQVIVNCCQSCHGAQVFEVKECTVYFKIKSGVMLYCSRTVVYLYSCLPVPRQSHFSDRHGF